MLLSSHNVAQFNLSQWLSYIEQLHPKTIELGLGRVNQLISRLNLHPSFNIITVAGTNGKGSTCAMLTHIYTHAGYRVGCYTSPHLLRYNERVKINGQEVSDANLCQDFCHIEAARTKKGEAEIALTYFEFGTLAAVWQMMQSKVEVAILEVGLGGRLDAVNAFEPDCAIVTSVDLDHTEFLGNTREKIGLEKAGVYRAHKTAICGDMHPPHTLQDYAQAVQAKFLRNGHDFLVSKNAQGWRYQWGEVAHQLPLPYLFGDYQLNNAACAITAVESLQSILPVGVQAIKDAMQSATVVGRFQTVQQHPQVILDVAHNPHAAQALAQNLQKQKQAGQRTIAVFAMLADKDNAGVINALQHEIDEWYVAGIDHVRGATAHHLAHTVQHILPHAKIKTEETIEQAYRQAYKVAGENDRIIVFGSFYTVANVLSALGKK